MRWRLALLAFGLCHCGSRTALEVDSTTSATPVHDGGSHVEPHQCRGEPWLIFELSGLSSSTLFAMRVDGTDGHEWSPANDGTFPSFSADGTKLFYVTETSTDVDGGYEDTLFVEDLAAGTRRPLATSGLFGDVGFETEALTYSALSPDGLTVAYTKGYDVRAVDIDGTNDRLVLAGSVDNGIVYGHPAFTADGQHVLYGTTGAFGVIGLDGSGNQTLVTQDGSGGPIFPNPTLSPDGANLASVISCASPDAGATNTTLRVYPFGSLPASCESGVVATTLGDMFAASNDSSNPAWGPSGLIAYGSGVDVYVVDPRGNAPPRNMTAALTANHGAARNPIWAPACAPIP